MGLHLPAIVGRAERAAAGELRKLGQGVASDARALEARLRAEALSTLDPKLRALTSRPNIDLVARELQLATAARDPKATPGERKKALAQMQKLMGAPDSDDGLDPLPPSCSGAAERARAKGAGSWDPRTSATGLWTTNAPGATRNSDPVNLYVHGDLASIVRALQQGGWSIAAPLTPDGCSDYKRALEAYAAELAEGKLLGSDVSQAVYHAVNRMPCGTLYLQGEPQLVSLEANNHPLTGRDHLRIFWTGKKDAQGKNIYAIAASRDAGLKLAPQRARTGFINHFTERNADAERDYVLQTLLAGGAQVSTATVQQKFSGAPPGGLFSKDGRVYDLTVG